MDPAEVGQPKELFFWGQSPLGVFNELTPLNQLFAGSYEHTAEAGASQTFNVQAVRNGLNFCIFVDQDSGMTYQIGAENMIDPYVDDALVSLSELRDAQFSDVNLFACGSNFVIGQSLVEGNCQASPMKNMGAVRSSPLKKVNSPVKKPVLEKEEEETSVHLMSPSGSKRSFPQRALY